MDPYRKHFKKMKTRKSSRVKKEVRLSERQKVFLGGCGFLFLMAAYGLFYPEVVSQYAKSVSLGVFSQSLAKDGEVSAESKGGQKEKNSEQKTKGEDEKAAKKDLSVYKNPNYISKLMDKEREIEKREAELKNLEAKLQIEKGELEKKIERLEQARREIASRLDSRVKEDEESIMKLVGIYSNMKPQNAAFLLMKLDENLAVSVLKKMKKQVAGSILNYVNPKKAKVLSEKYSGY